MFEHLGRLSKQREGDVDNEQEDDPRLRALGTIREVNEDSGIKGKLDESAEINSADEGEKANKPGETMSRRSTIKTEISERDMLDFEQTSEDSD